MSLGYSAFSSISAARGATRSCTSSRIVSRIASCSSENSKSMVSELSSVEEIARDHHALDLIRALVDLKRLGVTHVTLEGSSRDRPFLPRELQRVQRQVHRRVRA